jgi:uncharacterized protein with von Willebrand factor type A (vWA) domain
MNAKKIKYRYLCILLIVSLILPLSVGCGGKKDETVTDDIVVDNTENIVETETETETEAEIEIEKEGINKNKFEEFVSNEPQKEVVWEFLDKSISWETLMPYINPLGDESNYSNIEYKAKTYIGLDYIDMDNIKKERYVYGDYWKLEIPFDESKTEDENLQFLDDIKVYIDKNNGEIISKQEEKVIFVLIDKEGDYWWGRVSSYYQTLVLEIVKENVIKVGDTIVIHPKEEEDNLIYFSSYCDGESFQILKTECDVETAYININTRNYYGDYYRRYDQSVLSNHFGEYIYNIGNISGEPGFSQWEISWYNDNKPNEIKLKIEEPYKQDKVLFGEMLGAIKVSADYINEIIATPTRVEDSIIDHPEFDFDSIYLDKTPDGDYLLYVPSGYWDVTIYPKNDSVSKYYVINGVPVNSGEVTQVEVPYPMAATLGSENLSADSRGIDISRINEDIEKGVVEIEFSLLDKTTKDILPSFDNTSIIESGKKAKILEVKQLEVPPNIVLLLDSSGSMRGELDGTLKAAKKFIEGLPEDTNLTVIDFDDTLKVFKGETKESGIEALKKIYVGGDTALYQSIIEGIDQLANLSRTSIVLFTDGENDLGGNEKYIKEDIIDIIEKAEIPLFAIGFGKGHDKNTLSEFAKVSNGLYFNAINHEALESVFNSINERIGSTYILTYERPKEAAISDIPMVTFIIDSSGSMSSCDGDQDSRSVIVDKMITEFIIDAPPELQMQLMRYTGEIFIIQTTTTDKKQLLYGIDKYVPGSSTDIPNAVSSGIKMMKEVPTSKKMIVFMTDEALVADEQEMIDSFKELKKENIKVLWVGLGEKEIESDFIKAAELSDGEYIVTTDKSLLKEAFDRTMKELVEAPKTNLSQIYLQIEKENSYGERESYGKGKLILLSPLKKSDEVILSETIKYKNVGELKQYDKVIAKNITGDSVPTDEVIISKRIIIEDEGENKVSNKESVSNKQGENEAVKINAKEIVFLDKIKGVSAPAHYRFMALSLEFENILEAQEVIVDSGGSSHPANFIANNSKIETEMKIPSYLIPNITNHFFVSFNDIGSFPAMKASWLLNKPLVKPGNISLLVAPNKKVEGSLLFLVPDEAIERLSLHLYDTVYNTINLPIVGKLNEEMESVKDLPTESLTTLSETFDMSIIKVVDGKPIMIEKELNENSAMKQIYGGFVSKVQALLDINPAERFLLELVTENGSFFIPLHPGTSLIPFGLFEKTMLAPGSYNRSAWLFELPKSLLNNESNLYMELSEKDAIMPVNEGSRYPGSGKRYSGEYLDMTINNAVQLEKNSSLFYAGTIVLDVTFHDYKDGFSSIGVNELLNVDTINKNGEIEKAYEYDDSYNIMLLLNGDSVINDGVDRRGFLIYTPYSYELENITKVTSTYFDDLDIEVEKGFIDNELFVYGMDLSIDKEFDIALNNAINIRVSNYEAIHPEESESLNTKSAVYSDTVVEGESFSMPQLSLYGRNIIDEIDSVEELKNILNGLRYLPSSSSEYPFEYSYGMEALITQGFGTENDFANMTVRVLSSLGYSPKKRVVQLTKKGRQVLQDYSKSDIEVKSSMPAVSYMDDDGLHLLVLPFIMDLKDLSGISYYSEDQNYLHESKTVILSVSVEGYYNEEGRNEQLGDISDALSGDSENEPVMIEEEVLSERLNLSDLSLDSVDIGFTKEGENNRAFLITNEGVVLGEKKLSVKDYDIENIIIRVEGINDYPVHTTHIDNNRNLEDIFFTVSINSPDILAKTQNVIKEKIDEVYNKVEDPSDLSAIRWYHRKLIAECIFGQSIEETKMAKELNLVIGRTDNRRIIVVSSKGPVENYKMDTSIDLLNIKNTIHSGSDKAKRSFSIMNGLYMTTLEKEVLGDNGYGVQDIWELLPEDTILVLLEPGLNNTDIEELENAGLPYKLIDYFQNQNNYILIPNKPAVINDVKRYAWLEIDPETYDVIGKLDTFENGAMASQAIINSVKSAGQYLVGVFVGTGSSVWAVAAFSLEESDYKIILEKAKNFALGLKSNFGVKVGKFGIGVGGKPSISQKFGDAKGSFDGKFNLSQNVLGFTQGYEEGVNFYFDIAK